MGGRKGPCTGRATLMEAFVVLAGVLFVGLLFLARRRGKFDRIGPDDTPGDGVAEHMDGLVEQHTINRPTFRNPMSGGGSIRGGSNPMSGGGSRGGGGDAGGGGGGGGF